MAVTQENRWQHAVALATIWSTHPPWPWCRHNGGTHLQRNTSISRCPSGLVLSQ